MFQFIAPVTGNHDELPWLLIAATVDDGGGEDTRTGFAPIECAVRSEMRLGISSVDFKCKFQVSIFYRNAAGHDDTHDMMKGYVMSRVGRVVI